ncbi:uncharacterized protein BKA78DRAFT_344097 [Phyllosticta capitalensis]|uniref:uncharacterized protein n=1 Tax=Phyllosticta capitalensis TaxID=121624 RepID=UPI00312D263C
MSASSPQPSEASSFHTLYTAEYVGGGPVNHVAFVLVAPDSSTSTHSATAPPPAPTTCTTFDVTGSILAGMVFRIRPSHPWPERDPEYIAGSLRRVGRIAPQDLERWEAVCRAVEPPGKQVRLNGERIDKGRPLRRCTEWLVEVEERACGEGVVVVE